MKKKLNKRKKFAPLQRHEDREHAKYFLAGALIPIILWIISN